MAKLVQLTLDNNNIGDYVRAGRAGSRPFLCLSSSPRPLVLWALPLLPLPSLLLSSLPPMPSLHLPSLPSASAICLCRLSPTSGPSFASASASYTLTSLCVISLCHAITDPEPPSPTHHLATLASRHSHHMPPPPHATLTSRHSHPPLPRSASTFARRSRRAGWRRSPRSHSTRTRSATEAAAPSPRSSTTIRPCAACSD